MINKVILIGNLGGDPEVRALETGVKMARLRIATTERIYNSSTGEKRDHTEWHTVVVWRSQAEFAERYLRKGAQIYVEGKIRSREWNDEATGAKRHLFEIYADELRQLGRRSSDSPQEGAFAPAAAPAAATVPLPGKEVDDLPF